MKVKHTYTAYGFSFEGDSFIVYKVPATRTTGTWYIEDAEWMNERESAFEYRTRAQAIEAAKFFISKHTTK